MVPASDNARHRSCNFQWKGDRDDGNPASFGEQCAKILEEKGAEVIEFDWADHSRYADALKDVKTVFCSLPHIKGWADAFPAFLSECKARKVEHFVKISFLRPTHAFKGVAEIARQYRDNVPVRTKLRRLLLSFPVNHSPTLILSRSKVCFFPRYL